MITKCLLAICGIRLTSERQLIDKFYLVVTVFLKINGMQDPTEKLMLNNAIYCCYTVGLTLKCIVE